MSKKNRRTFTGKEKFNIVLEALKGQRQIVDIASEYGVHPNQITNWKQEENTDTYGYNGNRNRFTSKEIYPERIRNMRFIPIC